MSKSLHLRGLSGLAPTLGLAITLGLAALALAEPAPLRALRAILFDSYQQNAPRPFDRETPVRIVAIDDASLKAFGQWPWRRDTLARLVTLIGEAKPAAIALDVLLSEPERDFDGLGRADDALAQALSGQPGILGQVLIAAAGQAVSKSGFSEAGDDPRLFLADFGGAIPPLPALSAASKGVGALNFVPERDLVVRKVPLVLKAGGVLVPSLVAEALRVAQGADTIGIRASNAGGQTAFGAASGINAVRIGDIIARTERDGGLRVHFAGLRPERTLSAADLLNGTLSPAALSGRIVLIGATAAALSDVRATPLDPAVPGVEIHAEAIEHLLAGRALQRPDFAPGLEAVLVLVLGAAGLVLGLIAPPLIAGIGGLALAAAAPLGSWLAFARFDQLFDPLPAFLAFTLVASLGAFSRWRIADQERAAIRTAFSRYVSPVIVERLAADPSRLVLGGETRRVSILFADIHHFTRISETLSAGDVIELLNHIHDPLTEIILDLGGTIDKFLGDGLMAFWNAPIDQPDHAERALEAAFRMIEAVSTLRLPARLAVPTPLALGIGIATGNASVGNLGARRRFDYSVVGDTVNVAARLEPLTRHYPVPLLVDEQTRLCAPGFDFTEIASVSLRGRAALSVIYAPSRRKPPGGA